MTDVRVVETTRGPIEAAFVGDAGPAVIVLHGMPGSWRQALPLGEDLSDRYRVLLPSRPGYGATPLATGTSAADQADAYAALLDAEGIDRAAIIGISGGGPSAAAFAARHADRCTALVLVCALAPHLLPVPRAMRFYVRIPLPRLLFPLQMRGLRKRLAAGDAAVDAEIGKGLTDPELQSLAEDPLMRDRLVGFARSQVDAPSPFRGFVNDAHAVLDAVDRNIPPDLRGVTAPTTVFAGSHDTVVPSPAHEFWSTVIPHAQLHLIDGGGHAFLITRRLQTMPLIEAALAHIE